MNKVIKLAAVVAILVFTAAVVFLKIFTGHEKVVVIKENVTAGTVLSENMLTVTDIPALSRVNGSFANSDALVGKTLLVDRFKNDQIGSGMIGDKKREIREGEGIITVAVSREEADNIKPGDKISIIVFQGSGDSRQIEGFTVNKMTPRSSTASGQDEYILSLTNQTKANEAAAPFIKSGNFKVEVLGG